MDVYQVFSALKMCFFFLIYFLTCRSHMVGQRLSAILSVLLGFWFIIFAFIKTFTFFFFHFKLHKIQLLLDFQKFEPYEDNKSVIQ